MALLQKTKDLTMKPSHPKCGAQRRNQVHRLNEFVLLRPMSALASLTDDQGKQGLYL